MNNSQIAVVLQDIASLLEMKGENRFTVLAYQRASRLIDHYRYELSRAVGENADLTEIPGIGKALSSKITELVTTGNMQYFENLLNELPEGILEVVKIRGIGPKTAISIHEELGISTVNSLQRAIEKGELNDVPGIGKKKAQSILREICFAKNQGDGITLARAIKLSEDIIKQLRDCCPDIKSMEVVGSIRRMEETINDINLVCVTTDMRQVVDVFVKLTNVDRVVNQADRKVSVMIENELQANLMIVDKDNFGSAMQYFTGDQQHSVGLKDRALEKGFVLSEYGLKSLDSGKTQCFNSENLLYERLGMQFIPPELRQGIDEINLASGNKLPCLVDVKALRGDLHVHTDWSDGNDNIETMVAGARAKGHEYVVITDHSSGRGVANGLTVERLDRQATELRRIAGVVEGIKILKGSEVDIRADGTLDYGDEDLAGLDWVVASIHSGMSQSREVMTKRIIRAMSNPYVTAIGHLSTRRIGHRAPVDADYGALFTAAVETGTVLEINSAPDRLDLKDTHARLAKELGALMVIDSDAHTVDALDNQRYGVAVARRAGCEAKHIVNTLPLDGFLKFISINKSKRIQFMAENE